MDGNYEAQLPLDGFEVHMRIWMISDTELRIEVVDEDKYRRWGSTYKSNYIDSIAKKAGLKSATVLWKMIQVGIMKKSKEVTLELKSEDDFNAVLKESKGGLVLIVRYANQFDSSNIPLIIASNPFQPNELITIIKSVKKEKRSDSLKEIKLLEKQIFELNQAFANEKRSLLDEINEKDNQIRKLKDDIMQKNEVIKNLKTSRLTGSPVQFRRPSSSRGGMSLMERQEISDKRRSVGASDLYGRSINQNRYQKTVARKSLTSVSGPVSASNSKPNSRNSSAQRSRNSSVASSRSGSVIGSRKSTPQSSRCSSRGSEQRPTMKRFDPTEWNKQRLLARKRQESPSNRQYY